MTAAGWAGALLVGGWVGCAAGYFLGHGLGRRNGAAELEQLVEELDNELTATRAQLVEAAAIDGLNRNIETAFGAGIMHGQVLQAEREANDL